METSTKGIVIGAGCPVGCPGNRDAESVRLDRVVMPSNCITVEMIELARVDDSWHFAANLNAMMKHGYCKKCGLTPSGCKREGCGA